MPHQVACTTAITKFAYTNSLNIVYDWQTNLFFLKHSNNLFRLEGFSVSAYFLRNKVPGVVRKRLKFTQIHAFPFIFSLNHTYSFQSNIDIMFQPDPCNSSLLL